MGVHPPFRQKDGRTAARPLRSECRRHSDMAHTAFIFEGLKAFALHSQVRSFGHSQTRWNRSRSRDRLHPSEDAESLAVPSCRDQCRIASGCKGCLQHAPPPPERHWILQVYIRSWPVNTGTQRVTLSRHAGARQKKPSWPHTVYYEIPHVSQHRESRILSICPGIWPSGNHQCSGGTSRRTAHPRANNEMKAISRHASR